MKTYYLITNTSGCKYWSYLLTKSADPIYRLMIKKYGPIYVNQNGGWFAADAVVEIHKIIKSNTFPVLEPVVSQRPEYSTQAIAATRKALKDDAAGNKQCTMTDLDSACDMLDYLIALRQGAK